MTKRRGFTLVEMLVVLSVLAFVLPLAGGTIFFLLRAQSHSAEGLRDALAMTQISRTFRSDVHAARRARTADASALTLEFADARTIEYRAAPDGAITRMVRRGETVEQRQQFRLGAIAAKFAIADTGREAALTISATQRPALASGRAGIRIAAVVARNLKAGATVSSAVPSHPDTRSKPASPAKDQKSP
jgi:prepilin-type N-terminal cleavage/methylation domain-containing protein